MKAEELEKAQRLVSERNKLCSIIKEKERYISILRFEMSATTAESLPKELYDTLISERETIINTLFSQLESDFNVISERLKLIGVEV